MMCCCSNIASKLPVRLLKNGTSSRIRPKGNTRKEGFMVFSRLVSACSPAALVLSTFLLLGPTATSAQTTRARAKKPNIVVSFGDTVGYWNISAHSQGSMGYNTLTYV